MIERGGSPDGKINKFIDINGDGHRGVLVAVSKNKTKGIVIATTSLFASNKEKEECMKDLVKKHVPDYEIDDTDVVLAGRFYLVSEVEPESYPMIIKQVTEIPEDFKILR